jgi:hypothetical protein
VLNAVRRWKGVVDDPPHSGDWRVDDVAIKPNCDDLLTLIKKRRLVQKKKRRKAGRKASGEDRACDNSKEG